MWNWLKGKKTYIVAIATSIYGCGIQQGWWPHNPIVDYLLLGGGLAALRSGISAAVNGTNTANGTNGVKAALLLALVLPALTGCNTTPQKAAFNAAGGTSVTVEAAVRAYDVAAAQGKTTVAQNLQVKAAYEKYQAAFAVLCDAGAVYAASGTTNAPAAAALQQATLEASQTITDLIQLVQTFGVKLN